MLKKGGLTNPFQLIRSHLTSSRKLETVSQGYECDITQSNENDHTDDEDVPGWEV
jgi:hypothetical protein